MDEWYSLEIKTYITMYSSSQEIPEIVTQSGQYVSPTFHESSALIARICIEFCCPFLVLLLYDFPRRDETTPTILWMRKMQLPFWRRESNVRLFFPAISFQKRFSYTNKENRTSHREYSFDIIKVCVIGHDVSNVLCRIQQGKRTSVNNLFSLCWDAVVWR